MSTYNQDNQLLLRIAKGDETAFRQLFDQYRDLIYSFSFHLTQSDIIAKDVVQDIFVKIWTTRSTLDQIASIRAWMLRLTRNHVLNGLKRKAHEEALLRQIGSKLSHSLQPIEEAIQYRELEKQLQQAIAQLPPQQQRCYLLSRDAGMKHDEIANTLDISQETVKKHIMAAIRSIKKHLSRSGNLLPEFFLFFL
ncbi:RNA polymerase sigma factor [Pseudoflavitalea rhizosphaerae]|uniref:RNA polymerase sigma factor n=1 Tax=Pseudoflavitalea rhizosphaerae TaxID=1884793 RepID=UPI0013DF2A81|nr:RNA polymerase sigma-70 factor [Pseudoflavitalea rhizosphaerae]